MKRKALENLVKWKNSPHRKPMILQGARQTGKTWLMKEFGKTAYKDYVYFNFDEQPELKSLFETNKNPHRLIELLSMIAEVKIEPQHTLIIFDEIQECSEALNSLKYFYENANEYHIITAGSLLGTLLSTPKSYPVGMVNLLNIYPLSFEEFLEAASPHLFAYYQSINLAINLTSQIEEYFHTQLIELYNYYLIVGGMPECVSSWLNEKDAQRISQIQQELIEIYKNDFSKHNGEVNSGRILLVFNSIPSQLAKTNEKFIYGAIKSGARAREFEEAIEWLDAAGMVNKVHNVSKVAYPLTIYKKLDNFKLFLFDTGLLKTMATISNEAILLNKEFQFKGALTENFVLQQLKTVLTTQPCFYADKNMELDFVVQLSNDMLVPLEVKAGENVKSLSLKKALTFDVFPYGIRFSKLNYKREEKIINLPLYLVNKLNEFVVE